MPAVNDMDEGESAGLFLVLRIDFVVIEVIGSEKLMGVG